MEEKYTKGDKDSKKKSIATKYINPFKLSEINKNYLKLVFGDIFQKK